MYRSDFEKIYEITINFGDRSMTYTEGRLFNVAGKEVEIVEIYKDHNEYITKGDHIYYIDALVDGELEKQWRYIENMPVMVTNYI